MFWQSSRAWHSACLVLIVSATYRNPFLRLSLSLRNSALYNSKYAKQLLLPELPSPSSSARVPGPAPPARHADRNTGRLPWTGLELGGNSGKSNILAHLSLAKNTESRAILRDDGMGKLCLESWVPPSRQGCQADVGRGTQSSPRGRGHRAWQTPGQH